MAPPISVDIHAHYFPERFFAVIEEAGLPFGARVEREPTGPIIDVKGFRTLPLEAICFDMGYTRPVDVVTKRLCLDRADQRRILGATAARLLRLG